MKSLVLLGLVLGTLGSALAKRLVSSDDIETLFKKALRNELSEEDSETLQDVVEILRRPETVTMRSLERNSQTRTTLDCIVCRSAFAALFDSVNSGQTDDQLSSLISFFCFTLGIENENVCRGVVRLNMPIISHIVRTTPEATPAAFCGLVLQSAHDRDACPFDDPRFEWQVQLPDPTGAAPNRTSTEPPLNVVLISDAHLDPLYEAGGVANCDEPTCCRKGQTPARISRLKTETDEKITEESIVSVGGEVMLDLDVAPMIRKMRSLVRNRYPTRNSAPAGYWGDYRNCDTPVWAYDEAIDTITETHKDIDLVYYIGDTIDHGVWETSYSLINDMNLYLVNKLRNSFGDDVPILPVIGNHESQPTNQFAPSSVTGEGLNTTWLYEAIANKWSYYLTDEAQNTLRDRGDYSMLIKPGLRAISVNNNVAYKYNWWLVYDPLDAKRHLDWLVEELFKAEQAGEKVHLLTHIPPGVHDLTFTWTREYNRIVNRFTSTIAAEFNGHTHSDEFKIFYNDEGDATNVAWGVGSVTSYTNYNLNYKIATFDSQNYEPQSIVNYVYNLTEANLTPNRRPHWFQLYDMKNTFDLQDLSATSMDNLVTSMVTTNRQLLDLYSAFFSKLSDARWPQCSNSNDCKLDNLCKTVVTVLWDRRRCEELTNLYYATRQIANQLSVLQSSG